MWITHPLVIPRTQKPIFKDLIVFELKEGVHLHMKKKPMQHDPASKPCSYEWMTDSYTLVLLQLWCEETAVVLACLRHLTEQQMKVLQTIVVRQSYKLDR